MRILSSKAPVQEKLLISIPISFPGGSRGHSDTCKDCVKESKKIAPNAESWRPITLRPQILASIIILSILLAVALQLLLQKNDRDGGLFCVNIISDASVGQNFAYLYLPVMIAVIYSIAWGWIDVDVKRMEPFFQMSKPGGASAEHSLLLEYPYDFIASVPGKAIRLKHWSVFSASVATILVCWGVTPLVGSIFNMAAVEISSNVMVTTNVSLLPPVEQAQNLNAKFFNLAYGILWLGSPPPPFTTPNFALLPFTGDSMGHDANINTTITAPTTLFSVELNCSSAALVDMGPDMPKAYSNGDGCSFPYQSSIASGYNYTVSYIGWYKGRYNQALSSDHCPTNFSQLFFAKWSRRETLKEEGANFSIFCQPYYYQQDVMATVLAQDGSVIDTSLVGPRIALTEMTFNATDFAFLLSTALSTLLDYQPGSSNYPGVNDTDIIGLGIVDQSLRLTNISVAMNTGVDISSYAFGLNSAQPDQIVDPYALADAFQHAYQILFSMAISTITVNRSFSQNLRSATLNEQLNCVTLDRTFTPLAQTLLVATAAIGFILFILAWKRTSELACDPSSIMDLMKLIPTRSATLKYCNNCNLSSLQRDKQNPTEQNFKLTHHTRPVIEAVYSSEIPSNDAERGSGGEKKIIERTPMEISTAVGLIWAAIHLIAITLLLILRIKIDRDNGLPLPSNSLFIQRLVLNYIPTAVSTFLEPFWVLINRTLCLLQPFEDLRRGRATKSASIDARYVAAPPQMALWRAVRTQHFVLAFVCMVSILANVLAVTLSGLFQVLSVINEQDAQFMFQLQPLIEHTENSLYSQFDVTYTLQESILGRTKPPTWTDKNYAYLPFANVADQNETLGLMYKAKTRGFGLGVTCEDQSFLPKNISLNSTQMEVNYKADNGTISTRSLNFTFGLSGEWSPQNASNWKLAAEIQSGNSNNFYFGWLRYIPMSPAVDSESVAAPSFSSNVIRCEMALKSSEAFVTVDSVGNVLAATEIADTQQSMNQFLKYQTGPQFLITHVLSIFAATPEVLGVWHNDPIALNWVDYIIKEVTGPSEAANVNPDAPVPRFGVVAPLVERIYQQLFAVNFGINRNILLSTPSNQTAQGTILKTEARVFFAPRMFEISLSILILDFLIAAAVYIRRPKKFLPHLPTNIAGVSSYFAHSQLLADVSSNRQSRQIDNRADVLCGFGNFIGTDGKAHVGIELHPYVTPLGQGEVGLLERMRMRMRSTKNGSEFSIDKEFLQ